jgi:hypothetical protein
MQTDLVLAAARGAVRDWAAHLKAMADSESGRIGAAHAAAEWRAAYRAAPININRFNGQNAFTAPTLPVKFRARSETLQQHPIRARGRAAAARNRWPAYGSDPRHFGAWSSPTGS